MIIRRAGRGRRFTMIDNDVIEDNELSFRSLGLLTYILSKPDDWRTDSAQLARTHAEGRDAVRTSLTELELAGYLTRDKIRRGRQWITETVVYDRPFDREIGEIRDNKPWGDGFSGVGGLGVGKSGAVPSTETKDYDQALPAPSLVTVHSEPGDAVEPREPDDPTPSKGEPPAAGRTPRKTHEETKQIASELGSSGFGLGLRLQKGLASQPGSLSVVDVRALARRLNDRHRAGQSRKLQDAMIKAFCANPARYTRGDLKGWTAFLAAMPKLEADLQGGREYRGQDEDPYANEKIV